MKHRYQHQHLKFVWILLAIMLGFSACRKADELPIDPYAGGKQALGIKFNLVAPKADGNQLTYKVTGLLPYKDRVKFYINEVEAIINTITETEVTVTLPDNVSSGGSNLIVDGQIFFGPSVNIKGKTELDASFNAYGSNGSINQIYPLQNGNLMLVGSFTDYASNASTKQPVNRLVLISPNGGYLNTLAAKKGANGPLTSILQLPNGQFIIGGTFSSFNERKSINSLTRLHTNGSLDTAIVELVNTTPLIPANSYDTVANFNGGVTGTVSKVYLFNNKLILQGRFSNYAEYFYERSTRDRKVVGYTKINNLLRLELNGKMDSTYNFDKVTGTAIDAGNGEVTASVMQSDGKLILVGSFTKYQNKTANRIVRIDNDGLVDQSFTAAANASISSIRYSTYNGKYMLAGTFSDFNGAAVNGVVRMNADGSLDPSFNALKFDGGSPAFAAQLSNGKIIVSGTFKKYNGIVRQGFMVLNADGSLADGYNNTGKFQGTIADIYEKNNIQGYPTVILAGNISMFDAKSVNNIVRFILKP